MTAMHTFPSANSSTIDAALHTDQGVTAAGPILITGAAGFIGSFVAARLASMGHTVIGCDNFNDYYSPQLKRDRVQAILAPAGVTCVPVELADGAAVDALFQRYRPALVVHLAAQAGVRYSLKNPAAYIQANVVAFSNVLIACQRQAIRHFVYASSSSVYGESAKVPFHEDDQTDHPISLYAATKKSNELMACSFSELYGMPTTGLRFFTVYGPWGRPDMAYFSFTQKMLCGEPIQVFAEGQLHRDFTYIDDVVESVVRLLFKPPATRHPHAIFNVGARQPIMMMEFINTLERVLDVRAKIDFMPMQPGDVTATFADTAKLRQWIDFAPETSLETGLFAYHNWYRHWARLPT